MRRTNHKAHVWKSRYVIDREQAHLANGTVSSPDQVKKRHPYIILHLDEWRQRWEYIVLLLACVNCFMVPVEIAVDVEFAKDTWY